jgi:glutaredoxin 2
MEGPKKLTGKKILPVLEDSDGFLIFLINIENFELKLIFIGNYHAESLDIVEWIQKAYPDKLCLAKQRYLILLTKILHLWNSCCF